MTDLSHISNWVFDLDNTLYPAECNLFAQVDQRMAAYIAEKLDVALDHARYLQKDYYKRFGTTLNGLMKLHGFDPEPFLDYVHDIDIGSVEASPELHRAIAALPGRRFIYTNGSRNHAEGVAGKLGILALFDDITDIAANDYCPKPDIKGYEKFLGRHGLEAERTAMFDDIPLNLEAPYQLGMTTVLVHSSYVDHPSHKAMQKWSSLPDYIQFETRHLSAFLRQTCGAAVLLDPV